MYYGNARQSARQSAQRWHWGNFAPNSYSSTGDGTVETRANWTVGEQQELYDTAWLVLKAHNVVGDTIIYVLAMELADKIAALRDRQKENRSD